MKQKHQEKEQYISMLAQDKEEMKVLYEHKLFNLFHRQLQQDGAYLSCCVSPVPPVLQAKLAELQDLVMRLVAERNDWYNRYTGAVASTGNRNPDLLPVGEDNSHSEHQVHAHTDPNGVSGAGKHNQH